MTISNEQYREIPIHNILGIRNTGRRVNLVCPVHSERTASFILYPDNSFHCFGCGIHGNNAIDFCMALGYDYKEALDELRSYL